MIDYDSFSRCHLTDIFFAFHAGAKELRVRVGVRAVVLILTQTSCGLHLGRCESSGRPPLASW